MHAPSAMDLLLAWERGLDQSPTRRALALLEACLPEVTPDKLANLSVGARDAHLLRLRESLFGNSVSAVSECPNCGERLDLAFSTNDVRHMDAEKIDAETMKSEAQTHQLHEGGYDITYRIPTSSDLLAISTADDNEPQLTLLQRCVTEVQQHGVPVRANVLPDSVIAAISKDMANADPQAQIELGLVCPECSHAWNVLFDVAAFLWNEIHAWAKRMLHEVHTLARAYGWRETDILAMSARRRQIYLELART